MAHGRTGLVVADAGASEVDSARGEVIGQAVEVEACVLGEEEGPSALGSEVVRLRGSTRAGEMNRGMHHNVAEMDCGVDGRNTGQSTDLQEQVEEGLNLHGRPLLEVESQGGDGVGAAEELSGDVGGCNRLQRSVGF